MKNISRHVGKLEIVRREPSSANGNPRYLLYIAGFHCYTAVDSSLAYAVPNFDGARVTALIGTHYGRPTLDQIEEVNG